jgi:predicted metalloprotease with PDZ domain
MIPASTGPLAYELDLTKASTDSFRVKLNLEGLNEQNTIFQFPTTLPGVYSVLDFGKNVVGFKINLV